MDGKHIIDFILDIIHEKERDYSWGGNWEVYIHPSRVNDIKIDRHFKIDRHLPSERYHYTHETKELTENEKFEANFETSAFSVLKLDPRVHIIENPDIGENEILFFNDESVSVADSPITVTNPDLIEKMSIRNLEDLENCYECGSWMEEIVVEGDDGEMFCSIECLRKVY